MSNIVEVVRCKSREYENIVEKYRQKLRFYRWKLTIHRRLDCAWSILFSEFHSHEAIQPLVWGSGRLDLIYVLYLNFRVPYFCIYRRKDCSFVKRVDTPIYGRDRLFNLLPQIVLFAVVVAEPTRAVFHGCKYNGLYLFDLSRFDSSLEKHHFSLNFLWALVTLGLRGKVLLDLPSQNPAIAQSDFLRYLSD